MEGPEVWDQESLKALSECGQSCFLGWALALGYRPSLLLGCSAFESHGLPMSQAEIQAGHEHGKEHQPDSYR